MSKTETHIVLTSGDRLDHYLAEQGICTSRSEAQKLIKDGFVNINGSKEKPSYKVHENDQIIIEFPPLKPTELKPHKVDFEILHEDEDILVLNKPVNLVVHPGAGNYETSLVHGLLYHCKDLSGIGGVERPGIVHRLDKGTSGVMVVAKNDRAHHSLSDQFKNHEVEKEYRALCLGQIQLKQQTLVSLMKRSETNRKKFIINQKKGKEAITHITVLETSDRVSYVSVKIDTGRTHQIRVHLHSINHPIMGDEVYGGTKKLSKFADEEKDFISKLEGPLLHALQLGFTHPLTRKKMSFKASLPEKFQQALNVFFEINE